jgi:23S rRNA pseudouridine2605 synthase
MEERVGSPTVRLQKFLAHAGVASRRAAERLIADGRVTLDGETITDPARDVTDADALAVDGRPVGGAEERVVYAVNKPAGVVSTAKDPQRRPTVIGLVPGERRRLYPVGRLDADVTGLLLLTNDGDLANVLTHPSREVPRVYVATIAKPPMRERALRRLREGVELEDGTTAPARARRLGHERVELTIHEGRKRQVKRMLKEVGHPVISLERVAFGPLRLGDLKQGAHRRLSSAEVERLRKAALRGS